MHINYMWGVRSNRYHRPDGKCLRGWNLGFCEFFSSGKMPVCREAISRRDVVQTFKLSEPAVALLRFRVKGHRTPVTERRAPAFRELVDAGIMVPDAGDFRFTEDGWARREEILREEEERIERERYEPPDASGLSVSARGLLRRIISGRVEVTPENGPAFRELAAARVIILGHSFTGGRESTYRWTYWGHRQRFEIAGLARETA
jgi:hypothetical protein